MVIYAVQNYLINKLDTLIGTNLQPEQIIVGGWQPNDKATAIHLRDMGGSTEGYPSYRSDALIQIVTRAKSDWDAMTLSRWVFDLLREFFMLELYEETGKEIFVSKIGAIQRPSAMGTSTNGLYQYVFNLNIVFSEKPNEVVIV